MIIESQPNWLVSVSVCVPAAFSSQVMKSSVVVSTSVASKVMVVIITLSQPFVFINTSVNVPASSG